MGDVDLEQRLADLAARVAALEAGPAVSGQGAPGTGSAQGAAGTVAYQGEVRLHGEVRWTIALDAAAVLDLPAATGSAVLSALGHPVRAAMVRRLLAGPAGGAELQRATGVASTGQLYHHLRTLTGSGVVEQDGRGSYRVPPAAVVPVLVLLLAAADIAGDLR